MNRRPISPASNDQRTKVHGAACRVCARTPVDPAHVISRALGGCDSELCVIPLCRQCHADYDNGRGEVLAVLTKDEQAHAVAHVGILSALHRTTHLRWTPETYRKEPA